MLTRLSIQNVVIIEKLEIEFQSGLCALTGETGAGKSILLDSLGLVLGKRADTGLVRQGADKALVSAVFEMDNTTHPAFAFLSENGLEMEEGEIILRRFVKADGGSKAFINDQPVSASMLRQMGEFLLEIHGQFDTRGLMDASTHMAMLDEYAGVDKGELKNAWSIYREALKRYETLKEKAENARVEEEYLRGALEDLDTLAPQAGEEESLASLREQLIHRESVIEGLNAAFHALTGEEDPIRAAFSRLSHVEDKLGQEGEEILGALERAAAEVETAITAIQSASADLQETEHDLESIDDRLFSLRGQARKHQCSVDELPAIREKIATDLDAIENVDARLAEAMKAVDIAKSSFVALAGSIHETRVKAAKILDQAIMTELAPLKMERARFETRIEKLEESRWGENGVDNVRFLAATNPGSAAGPLNKIASGGEMSRFMLALKVVMAQLGKIPSLVFDEVDAGIGGSTADAVGERLSRLAKERQVLVVTHSPQVAARADHHWIVSKAGSDSVVTSVEALPDRKARAEEIARMLAGSSITQEARAAADKLLEASAAA